jgi:hypothetical protein
MLSPFGTGAVALVLVNVIEVAVLPVMLLASLISRHILSKASFASSRRVF